VACRDSNQVRVRDCQINTLPASRAQIPVASKAPMMSFLIYAATLTRVTSL